MSPAENDWSHILDITLSHPVAMVWLPMFLCNKFYLCSGIALKVALINERCHRPNFEKLFGRVEVPGLNEMFAEEKFTLQQKNKSSAVWDVAILFFGSFTEIKISVTNIFVCPQTNWSSYTLKLQISLALLFRWLLKDSHTQFLDIDPRFKVQGLRWIRRLSELTDGVSCVCCNEAGRRGQL